MLAREATFDPVRGAFVVLARPEAPEPVVGDRKMGLRVGQHKDTGHLKAIMVRSGGGGEMKLTALPSFLSGRLG